MIILEKSFFVIALQPELEIAAFSSQNIFFLDKKKMTNYGYLGLDIWQTFSWKWSEVILSLQGKQLAVSVAKNKIRDLK